MDNNSEKDILKKVRDAHFSKKVEKLQADSLMWFTKLEGVCFYNILEFQTAFFGGGVKFGEDKDNYKNHLSNFHFKYKLFLNYLLEKTKGNLISFLDAIYEYSCELELGVVLLAVSNYNDDNIDEYVFVASFEFLGAYVGFCGVWCSYVRTNVDILGKGKKQVLDDFYHNILSMKAK